MCELCGKTPCRPLRQQMASMPELSKDDWRIIFDFLRFVQLPFLHTVIIAARKREGLTIRKGLPPKQEENSNETN